jgi:hypothetical protein
MRWSDIPFQPSSRTLRQFAALCLAVFTALAGWRFLRHGDVLVPWLFLGLAFTLGPLGLVRPQLLRPVFVGWMIVVFPIGWLVSHLVLAVLFYGLFTPLGLIFRLAGRDALACRRKPGQNSFWTPKPAARDVRSYFRQS